MPFNASVTELIRYAPWRYTTQPTYNPDGAELTPGVKQALAGVFIRIDEDLFTKLSAFLIATERTELSNWIYRVTDTQAANWNVPLWSGETSAIFLRIPAALWADPNTPPPAKVKRFFNWLYREDL